MTNLDPASSPPAAQPAVRPRRARRLLGLAALLLGGIAVGSAATKAFSHGPFGFGHHGGWHRASMLGSGPIDPARMDERIERGLKHFAIEADTTPEQTQKLTAIAKAAARDLLPLREKAMTARQQAMDLFKQPAIDRGQIERLRAEQVANMEAISRRLSQALGDAAEILTPEQRKKLAERIEERRARWRRG